METLADESSIASGSEQDYPAGVRLLVLNLPEDEGEGLGFRLTRTLWDPYPWVREVTAESRADVAGLKTGDCLLQADGKDLLGLPVGQVAGLIRGDGAGRGVSLLVWNCGVNPKDDPELLWSCGGASRGERSRRALAGAVRALACCVCASTATEPLCCARSHLYCSACWSRLERCALCRETLPPKESPYARNLVAEQVFEAIAAEYEIKNVKKRPTETSSAYASPNRSPNISPSVNRRGQYQLSLMNRKKQVQFTDKYKQTSASDPNLHKSSIHEKRAPLITKSTNLAENSLAGNSKCDCQNRIERTKICNCEKTTNLVENSPASNTVCSCQKRTQDKNVQTQTVNIPEISVEGSNESNLTISHKLVARLRQACSLADLQSSVVQTCQLSKSLNHLGDPCKAHGSLENLKSQCATTCDSPVFLLSAPPIYVVTCEHNKTE